MKAKFFNLNHLLILCTVLLFLIVIGFSKQILFKEQTAKLNLILISIDTLRPDHMGVYGYDKNTTPNIDEFAKNAVVFTNARTMVPMTYPSFSELMTGISPFNSKIFVNRSTLISNNTRTLATILRQNGFTTGAFTTGALGPIYTNFGKGFNQNRYLPYKSYFFLDRNNQSTETYQQDTPENYNKYVSDAISWLENNKKNRFFFWVHLLDPHEPYQSTDNLKCKFNTKYCNYIQSKTWSQLETERAKYQFCQNKQVPNDQVELQETLYDGSIGYTDLMVGKIIEAIKSNGLDKNSVIVIYGDHGEGFDHNYYFAHRVVLYESALRIPLIIYNPLEKDGKKSDLYLQNIDIFPTILDLLGINYKKEIIDGQSFSNVFSDNFWFLPKEIKRNYYYTNNTLTKYAIYDGRYKFIYSLPSTCLNNNQKEELYDLKIDPNETKNLVLEKKDLAASLKENLLDYLSIYNLPPSAKKESASFPTAELNSNPVASSAGNKKNNIDSTIEYLKSLPY